MEDAALEENLGVPEVAIELGEERIDVALGAELALGEIGALAPLRERNGVAEGVGDGEEEVEGERVGGGGGEVGQVSELGLEVGELALD